MAATWKTTRNLHSSTLGILVTTLVVISLFYYLSGDNNRSSSNIGGGGGVLDEQIMKGRREHEQLPAGGCNLFSGRWVYDDKSSPLYKEQDCSFMVGDFACGKFGRNEFKYQHWRWQPHDCDLPRFNGTALMEKLRGKRVVFVGDSLNKNQWMSMVCLLDSSLPTSLKSVTWKGSLITFQALEYKVRMDFYWEPLLVESNCDDPVNHHVLDRVIRVGAIEKHAKHWTDADVLIFNSFMWWLEPNMTLLWGSFGSSNGVYKTVNMRLRRYEMALRTWSDWLDLQINRTKTNLFFMSLSPYHKIGEDWGKSGGGNCYNETEPILEKGYKGSGTDAGMMRIAEAAINDLKGRGLRVEYINITQLSDYRKDGHPSIHRRQWSNLTRTQLLDPVTYADCVHWCLPGVPDVWNQLLYTYIMRAN
ncbi:OLC1v1033611C1 [Oldenlandia corymbosa var. corymbosa]|uniref:OLC1v1033611C1 n=1 Tax=Oldenlandia corymbosa var. corymbosa TaxID=529605 RepID=A0AAV1CPE8_OLDCO|nr:OLC1v1033611C1 [Oldenlandia corymbosa var. corymbosa]